MTLKERLSGDESSLTSELESEMCHEDLPMRQRPVKSPVLCLGFSSSSELEESSLEKSRSLSVTPTFYKNNFFCPNRSAYKNAYQFVVHMKNLPKINHV
jgi:hypothetical protein